jgi:hypothetical protein
VSPLLWWVLHLTGSDNLSGPWYGFWSGFGSDLGELAIVGGLVSLYWRHNCHVKRCWRIGRLPAGGFLVCHKHHPTGAPDANEVIEKEHRSRK